MACCDVCGNYDQSYREDLDYSKDSHLEAQSYQPDLYYYWDAPLEEIYYWRDAFPNVIVCVKSVLISPTKKRKLFGATINAF